MRVLSRLLAPSPEKKTAHALYVALVDQARMPDIYTRYGVPDTLDGRFDAIVLHLHLVLARLRDENSALATAVAQCLVEAFMADMDRNMREMGVGDTGVGKRVKNMASASLGRVKAYEEAGSEDARLAEALMRNLYRSEGPAHAEALEMARYARRYAAALSAFPTQALMTGALPGSVS